MLSIQPILVAGLATMPVGFLWYSPFLFAKPWMYYSKIHHMQMKKGPGVFPFLVSFFSAVVVAALLSLFISVLNIQTLSGVWKVGLLVWFGFDFFPCWMRQLFDKRPFELLLINSGHAAANVLVIGWVLMMMR